MRFDSAAREVMEEVTVEGVLREEGKVVIIQSARSTTQSRTSSVVPYIDLGERSRQVTRQPAERERRGVHKQEVQRAHQVGGSMSFKAAHIGFGLSRSKIGRVVEYPRPV